MDKIYETIFFKTPEVRKWRAMLPENTLNLTITPAYCWRELPDCSTGRERHQAITCRTPDLRRLCWAYGKTVKDRMCRPEYWGRGSSRGENYMNLWLVPLILGKAWLVCACKLWPGKIQPTRVRGKKYPVLRQEQKSTCFQVANWRTSKFTRN